MKLITLRDAQPGHAVFPRITTLMKPLGAVRSGGRSLDAGSMSVNNNQAENDQAGTKRDAAGVARDS
jgi:hypothetical protein